MPELWTPAELRCRVEDKMREHGESDEQIEYVANWIREGVAHQIDAFKIPPRSHLRKLRKRLVGFLNLYDPERMRATKKNGPYGLGERKMLADQLDVLAPAMVRVLDGMLPGEPRIADALALSTPDDSQEDSP